MDIFLLFNSCLAGGSGGTCGYVATGLSQSAACKNTLICTYTDSGASLTMGYTIKQADYNGNLIFWPGALVTVNRPVMVDVENYPVVAVGMESNANIGGPAQIASQCIGGVGTTGGGYSTCLASFTNQGTNQTATLLGDLMPESNTNSLSKGRLNFTTSGRTNIHPYHFITLIDSQPFLTQATNGYRPPANANDTWIGTDVPSTGVPLISGQLAFGAPVSITNYIRATGDGEHRNWKEQLTFTEKTFKVAVTIKEGNSFTLGDGSPLSRMKIYRVKNIRASHVPRQSCVDVIGEAKDVAKSDQITSITPPGRLGNLSLNAYPGDDGTIILHFCNPSSSEAITPVGAYSFLAVR
jgi:hypothetical protein